MIKPVKRQHVYEVVSEQIKTQIESGDWKEGERIPGEMELSEMFQVSRGSVREAIKSLQLIGVLEARSGQGTFVSSEALKRVSESRLSSMVNDQKYRDQVLECRYMIEPQAAFVAAQIAEKKDIDFLRETYTQMLSCTEKGDVSGMNKWGAGFHSYIVDMLNNDVLSALYRSIAQKSLEDREEFVSRSNDKEITSYHDDHLKIIEALEANDPVKARNYMDMHLGRKLNWKGRKSSINNRKEK